MSISEAERARARLSASGEMEVTSEHPGDETLGGSGGGRSGTHAYPAAHELQRGTQLGRYVILAKLGAGGMGVVYGAYDPDLDRKLAIKVLRSPTAAQTHKGTSRLLREAQALARVDHPNVVAIHDVGTHAGRVFVAMEFLQGPTLRSWTRRPGRPWRAILDAYVQAGRGLAAAHAAGIVHRDFKPENVMVVNQRPRVLDFGLAQASGLAGSSHPSLSATELGLIPPPSSTRGPDLDDRATPGPTSHSGTGPPSGTDPGYALPSDSSSLSDPITRAGAVLGTPAFMAPEQHLGEATGPASDQFAFAVALHEALYNCSPFPGETVAARAFAVTQGNVLAAPVAAWPSKAPLWIRKRLVRALALAPADRWPDMESLLAALADDPRAKARRWVAGLGLGGLAAAMLWVGKPAPAPAPCGDGNQALASAWSPIVRGELEQSFIDSKLPYATALRETTLNGLDAYASTWTSIHKESCEATRVRHEAPQELMDRKMACLDASRRRLHAVVERMRAGDALGLEHGAELVTALPSLQRCEQSEQLLAAYPAARGEQANAVALADEALAQVLARRTGGDIPGALELWTALMVDAAAVDYPPLQAELHLAHAELLEALGKPREAKVAVLLSMQQAELAGDDRRVTEARVLAGMVVGDRLAETEEGYQWLALAESSLGRMGGDAALEARRLNNLALVHAAAGRHTQELETKQAALRAVEALPNPDPVELAAVHNNLSASLSQQGDHEAAMTHAQRAIDLWTESLGAEHPKVAIGWASLGLVHDYAGEYKLALPLHKRALMLLEASLGTESPRVAEVLNNLAITSINLGDVERGAELFERVVDIKQASLGADHLDVASALGNLGSAQRMRKRLDKALEAQERARSILESQLPADHARLAGPLSGLANTYESLGRIEESFELRERVLKIEEKAHGPLSPEIAIDLGNLAWALFDAKQDARGRELAQRGLDILGAHTLKPDVQAFLLLVGARARLSEAKPGAQAEARKAIAAAELALGDLPAPAERDMIKTIEREQGW